MRTWYLIQFTPDLTAREPRNVGVVVHDDADNWAVRMLFVDKTGAVDPALFRPLGGSLTAEEYAGWVGYYKRAIMEGRWEQAVTLHLRRKVSFHVLKGGTLLGPEQSVTADARSLFDAVVAKKLREPAAGGLAQVRALTMQLLDECGVSYADNIVLPARWGDGYSDSVSFAFGVGNTVVEPLALGGQRGGLLAREFYARASAVRSASDDDAPLFVATYSGRGLSASGKKQLLRPVMAVATAVDVDSDDAGEALRKAMLAG